MSEPTVIHVIACDEKGRKTGQEGQYVARADYEAMKAERDRLRAELDAARAKPTVEVDRDAAETKQKPLHAIVAEYSNAVGRYGPDSEQVREVRAKYADIVDFLDYADALDRIKRHLGNTKAVTP